MERIIKQNKKAKIRTKMEADKTTATSGGKQAVPVNRCAAKANEEELDQDVVTLEITVKETQKKLCTLELQPTATLEQVR